jgi:hypothetical protein
VSPKFELTKSWAIAPVRTPVKRSSKLCPRS